MDEKVMTCFHCGNKTSMKCVSHHRITDNDEIWDYSYSPYKPVHVITFGSEWFLYLCPVCKEVTLEKETWCSEETEPNGKPITYQKIVIQDLKQKKNMFLKALRMLLMQHLKLGI
ncbi:hypothetical protein V7149_26235 [Bacillus sp. JJ1503]|uniref:hypothetical protein n=1 Tax=Bacillus sp. JJ1503 TaxID=3122956 RepID=UPI002FFE1044